MAVRRHGVVHGPFLGPARRAVRVLGVDPGVDVLVARTPPAVAPRGRGRGRRWRAHDARPRRGPIPDPGRVRRRRVVLVAPGDHWGRRGRGRSTNLRPTLEPLVCVGVPGGRGDCVGGRFVGDPLNINFYCY